MSGGGDSLLRASKTGESASAGHIYSEGNHWAWQEDYDEFPNTEMPQTNRYIERSREREKGGGSAEKKKKRDACILSSKYSGHWTPFLLKSTSDDILSGLALCRCSARVKFHVPTCLALLLLIFRVFCRKSHVFFSYCPIFLILYPRPTRVGSTYYLEVNWLVDLYTFVILMR